MPVGVLGDPLLIERLGLAAGSFAGGAARASLEELISFEVVFRRFLNEAYTRDLWGAGDLANGGCSNDGSPATRIGWVTRCSDRPRLAAFTALADQLVPQSTALSLMRLKRVSFHCLCRT